MAQNYCTSIGGNTGIGECDPFIGSISGLIMTPRTATITEQDAEDLLAFLIKKAKAQSGRYFPLLNVGNITDNTTEPTEGTLASTDYTRQLKGSKSIYLLEWDTTLCLSKVMAKYNNYQGGIFIITEDAKLWGRYNSSDGSLSPFTPFAPLSVYGAVFGDAQNLGTQKLKLNLGSQSTLIRTAGFFSFSDEDVISNILGVTDVELKSVGNSSLQVLESCGGKNLYDAHSTPLASPDLWTVTKDGVPVSITTVTADSDRQAFTLVPTLTVGTYKVSLAAIEKLEEAGVVGYEHPNPITLKVE